MLLLLSPFAAAPSQISGCHYTVCLQQGLCQIMAAMGFSIIIIIIIIIIC
jgi:hypothetical protein